MPFCVCGAKSSTHHLDLPKSKETSETPPAEAAKSNKKKVYITRALPDEPLEMLKDRFDVQQWNSEDQVPRDKLLQGVSGASAIICTIADRMDKEVLEAAGSQLQIICSMTADLNHVDVEACTAKNVQLHHVADLCADANAEMTCALLLVTARRLMEGYDAVMRGEWGLWKPMWICGIELHEKTLGILGFGRVGWGVANRLKPFGIVRILYYDKDEHPLAGDVGAEKVELEQLFSESDFIVCTLALTPETNGIVSSQYLTLCKPECIFVNTARGELVNHDHLLAALQEQKISGAGLDVTDPEPLPSDHPFLQLANCVVTPHMGTATEKTRKRMTVSMVQTIISDLA